MVVVVVPEATTCLSRGIRSWPRLPTQLPTANSRLDARVWISSRSRRATRSAESSVPPRRRYRSCSHGRGSARRHPSTHSLATARDKTPQELRHGFHVAFGAGATDERFVDLVPQLVDISCLSWALGSLGPTIRSPSSAHVLLSSSVNSATRVPHARCASLRGGSSAGFASTARIRRR